MRVKKSRRKRKAFLFTIDSLFALALVTIAAYSFIVFAQQPPGAYKVLSLNQLGHDYLKLEKTGGAIWDENAFKELTDLSVSADKSDFDGAALVARAELFYYPSICEGTGRVEEEDECLTTQEIKKTPSPQHYFEAFITPWESEAT